MQHIAFRADTEAELLAMRDRVRSRGINVIGPIDHGMCRSIYFAGPDQMTLEIAASRTETKRSKPASNKPKPSDRTVGDPLPADPHQIDLEDLDNTPDTYIKQLTRKDLLAKARTAKRMGAQFINHYDLG